MPQSSYKLEMSVPCPKGPRSRKKLVTNVQFKEEDFQNTTDTPEKDFFIENS